MAILRNASKTYNSCNTMVNIDSLNKTSVGQVLRSRDLQTARMCVCNKSSKNIGGAELEYVLINSNALINTTISLQILYVIPTQVIEIPMKQANFEFNGDKYDNQMIFQVWYPKEDIRDPDADKKVRSQ